MSGYAPDGLKGETKNRVLHYMSLTEDPVTVAETAEHLGINLNAMKVCFHRLAKSGEVTRVHRGQYLLMDGAAK
jgi:predicted transcriptional regulator of viral defense system